MGIMFYVYTRHRSSGQTDYTVQSSAKMISGSDAPATLRIRRDWQYADSLRDYHIVIDGKQRGDIEAESEVSFQLIPGPHKIEFTMDWVGSPEVTLDFQSGEQRTLSVSSNAGGPLGLYYITFGRRKYLSVSESTYESR